MQQRHGCSFERVIIVIRKQAASFAHKYRSGFYEKHRFSLRLPSFFGRNHHDETIYDGEANCNCWGCFACLSSVLSDSIDLANQICEPGFYTFTENGSNCQVCPPGMFSEVPGACFCKLCLDTFYSDEGANSAELWNGDLYCLHLGLVDDDLLNSNSGERINPTTVSSSPSRIEIVFDFPSTIPSHMHRLGGSEATRSSTSETPPSTTSTPGDSQEPSSSPPSPLIGNSLIDDSKPAVVCNDQNDHFEWHGRCKKCPFIYEMFLQPVFVLLILAILTLVLEILIPVASTLMFGGQWSTFKCSTC